MLAPKPGAPHRFAPRTRTLEADGFLREFGRVEFVLQVSVSFTFGGVKLLTRALTSFGDLSYATRA